MQVFWDLSGFYEFPAMLWFGTSNLTSMPNVLPFCAPELEFGRPKSFGLPFSGLDQLTSPFWSTESEVFDRPIGFRSAVFWARSVDQSFLVYRIRGFRSTDWIFGLPILVWVVSQVCFLMMLIMFVFMAYCAHDFNKIFQRGFLRKNMDGLQMILPRFSVAETWELCWMDSGMRRRS